MRKAVGLVAIVAAMAFVGVAVAAPGHTVTVTQTSHTTDTHPDTQPCNGDPVLLTQTTNMINHVTYFPGGDEAWGTFTEEDKIVATDLTNNVVYSGHSTFWGNFNINNKNSNDTFTGSIRVRGTDGSYIAYHEVAHETFDQNGNPVVQFDRPTMTCGG
jgi:hypothetical protein